MPRGRGGRREIPEERAVDEAALDQADPGGDAQATDQLEPHRHARIELPAGDRTAGDLGRRDRGGNDRHARMKDRPVVGVVVVARMRHDAVDPRGMRCGNAQVGPQHRRLGLSAPVPHQRHHLRHARGGQAGDRAGERVENVQPCRRQQVGPGRGAVEAGRELGELFGEVDPRRLAVSVHCYPLRLHFQGSCLRCEGTARSEASTLRRSS